MTGKIKAFTIFELVLAMLLAVIVIGMAYSAYSIFFRIYKNYSVYVDRNTEVLVLRRAIQTDFDKATHIAVQENAIVFKRAAQEETVIYEINPQFMVRVSILRDTFYLKDLMVFASFENQPCMNGILDQLVLRFQHSQVPLMMRVNKLYTSEELFEHNQN